MALKISMALALLFIIAQCANAQSTSSCTPAIMSLMPCLGYITGNSSNPSSSCCTQLASVVKTQALCLCTLLNNGAAQFGININQSLAMTLPGKCNIQTPPISQCSTVAPAQSPVALPTAPAAAPEAPTTTPTSPTTVPSVPATPSDSGKGSKNVPSTTGESSDASSYKSTSVIFSAVLFVISVSSLAI